MKDISRFFKTNRSYSGVLVDQDTLVYLSDASGMPQVYKKNLTTGESICLTDLSDRVWKLYDTVMERKVFFLSDSGGNEKTQIYMVDVDTGDIKNLTANPNAVFQFGGVLLGGKQIIASSNARNEANYDIVKVDIETGESQMVLQNSDNYNLPAALSPDGANLLYNKMKGMSDDTLWSLNTISGETEQIHSEGYNALYSDPCWKLDSSGFYLLTDFDCDFVYVAEYDMKTKKLTKLYETSWNVGNLALSPDGRYLAMTINEEGYSTLKIMDLSNGSFVNTPLPPKCVILSYFGFGFSPEGNQLTFTVDSVKRPGNVWILDIDADCLYKATDTSWEDLSADELVEPELCRFQSFDGLSVPYWLYRKPQCQAGAPVVIEIHGGPEGQEHPLYNAFISYLVSQGFVVVAPNVRGSTGYGKKYHHLDDVEKRLDSVHDIEALVNHLIKTDVAKQGCIGVMGASYGGYMTLASITQYPRLFAAAIDIVGMSDLETFLENTAEYRRSHRESEYGSLEKDRATLRRVSPIHKSDEIVTPLMVIHGANDPRVPLSEAKQIVKSLNDRGVVVEFLCYNDEGHGLSKLKNKLDCYPKAAAFLNRHLNKC